MSPVAGDVENLGMIDTLGSPDTYDHYPTGWAVAFSTACSSAIPGIAAGRPTRWSSTGRGGTAKGELRHQHHHCTDIVPTILECCGVTMSDTVDGVKQTPLRREASRQGQGARRPRGSSLSWPGAS